MTQDNATGLIACAFRVAGRVVIAGAVLAGLLAAGPASAQIQVITSDFPPLTVEDPAAPQKGLLYDVMIELLKLQGHEPKIQFTNWSEAQKVAAATPDVLLFPMTRTAKREAQYKWLVKMFDLPRAFAGRPGGPAVNSFEEAAKLKAVGVLVNSASLSFLKDKGVGNIMELPSNSEMMEALRDGRIDAIYQPIPFSKAGWKSAGGQGSLTFGKTLEESASYIVASPSSKADPNEWSAAFQVLEQEGTFEKLMATYGMKD